MGKYIQFKITNKEPLRIVDTYRSKSGELEVVSYIPGSSIRGVIINALAKEADFENGLKQLLLSDKVCFLNAYFSLEGKTFIPSLKGFYENKKQDGKVVNLLKDGKFDDGYKRANLGRFCLVEDNTICYTNVKMGESLNINTGNIEQRSEKQVYRMNFIAAGQEFMGYIFLKDEEELLEQKILKVLNRGNCRIGGSRSSGFGLCEISEIKMITHLPYQLLSITSDEKNKSFSEVYMVALSPLCMRNEWGEPCGIDWERLPNLLGVESFDEKKNVMSTSVCYSSGNNRTWGMKTPEIAMYESGSVFHLVASKNNYFDVDKLASLEQHGLGIGRNYGCGQVLFMKGIEKINQKKEIEKKIISPLKEEILDKKDCDKDLEQSARQMLRMQIQDAMNQYVVNHEILKQASSSQYGRILALYNGLKYRTSEADVEIKEYIKHERDKDVKAHMQSKKNKKRDDVFALVENIIDTDFYSLLELKNEILGFKAEDLISKEELIRYRLHLLDRVIRYAGRKEKHDESV